MKKIGLFLSLLTCSILLTGCFDKEDSDVIDDCIFPEDCTVNEPIEDDFSNKYLTAFGTEPFWDIEISGGIAKFSTPVYETDVEVPIKIWKEGENYYFSGEELEGEFLKKDCLDGGKGDLHYYTVGVAKIRDYYYEGCGDDEDGIKMIDEEYEQYREKFMSEFSGNIKSCEKNIENKLKMVEPSATNISYGWYNYENLGESYKVNGYVAYTLGDDYFTKNTTCTFQPGDFSDGGESGNGEIEY